MASYQLTAGSLAKMLDNQSVENAVVQILNYRVVADSRVGTERYRLILSDGVTTHGHTMVIASNLADRIKRGELEKFTIIRVKKFVTNKLDSSDKIILIIQDLDVVAPGARVNQRIGNPTGAAVAESLGGASRSLSAGLNSSVSSTTPNRSTAFTSPAANQNASKVLNTNQLMNTPNRSMAFSSSPSQTIDPNKVCPIDVLTPFYNAWTIRGRVFSKSQIRNWSNAKGEGKVFNFEITDGKTDIRVNGFTKECERFYDLIEVGKVYYISRGQVKTANKKFCNLNNDYEITLNQESVIQLADDGGDMPKLRYKFVEIRDLQNLPPSTVIDVIGVCKSVDEITTTVSRKTNKELKKREITLVDKSGFEVRMTLWNEQAENFDCPLNSVVAFKGAVVGEFNGKTLSTGMGSNIQIEPDMPEAHILKGWFLREGSNATFNALSKGAGDVVKSIKFISQINASSIGEEGKTYSTVYGTVVGLGRTPMYKSCGLNGCMKKVADNNEGMYHCDKCGTDSPTFEWRIILSACINDCTGQFWLTIFQEEAEKMLKITARELGEYQENNDPRMQEALNGVQFKPYMFRIGSFIDNYNQERRVKSQVYRANEIDPIKQSKRLLQLIQHLAH